MSLPPINYNNANENQDSENRGTWGSANLDQNGNISDGNTRSFENIPAQDAQNSAAARIPNQDLGSTANPFAQADQFSAPNTSNTQSTPAASHSTKVQNQNNTNTYRQYGQYGEANPQVQNFTSGYRTVIPMRPLGIGDTLDSTIRLLKFNPLALIVFPLLVAVVFTILDFVVGLAAGQTAFIDPSMFFSTEIQDSDFLDSDLFVFSGATFGILSITALITVLLFAAESTIVSISATRTIIASVRGYKLSLRDTWNIVKPRFWSLFFKLIGLAIILSVIAFVLIVITAIILAVAISISNSFGTAVAFKVFFALLLFLAFIFLTFAVYARLLLSIPALVAEDCGVLTAIKRSWQLTRGSFWHIAALLFFTFIFIFSVFLVINLSIFLLYGAISNSSNIEALAIGFMLISQLGTLLGTVFIYPVITTLINLLYVNMRFKRENFHQQLLFEANALNAHNPMQSN